MLVISSREFREKQAEYFDRVDNGEQIIVQSGKNKAYTLTPVTENDVFISKEYILQPDENLASGLTADEILAGIKEDMRAMFKRKKQQAK
jgi:antitoxin (DNA-binding transcriptional repressor) of toxin-antitoxin stability system